MVVGNYLGQMVGRRFGSYLGRQIALGACREDRDDDFERRPFTARLTSREIADAVDLRPWMTPVEDQGQLGSCAANALVGGVEYLVRRETGQHVDFSRLFVYFAQRLWADAVRDDLGASIVDGVRVLARLGVPTERSWPHQPDLFAVQPPDPVLREAASTRVADWWSVPVDGDAFRGCLAAGFPITFGTRVTESFVRTPRSGICGMPQGADDARHGRHALLAVGYDDRARVFVVRNSWGADWGDAGHVYMPYEYVLNRRWTSGCWALRMSAREAFDPATHGGVDLRSIPRAAPSGGASAAIGSVGAMGAQVAVGAFTGSGLLAGLAGGLIAGLTPGVSRALRGRDRGAFAGEDQSARMLAALRAQGAAPAGLAPMPWDDGLDEEATVAAIGPASARRPVRASPRRGGERAPVAPIPIRESAPAIATPPRPRARPAPGVAAERVVAALPEALAAPWRRDGGAKGPLGLPIAEPAPMIEDSYRGVVVRFADGAMFAWDPPPGAPPADPIVLLDREPAFTAWVRLGAGRSVVGWPVAPLEETPHATLLRCYRGSIVDHPELGVHPVHGAIFAYWLQLGGLAGELGHPVGAAVVPSDPRAPQSQRFEHGTLSWSSARGVWRE